VVGNPGKIIRQVSDEMLAWKTEGTKIYQQLPQQCFDTLLPCEPLPEERAQTPLFTLSYKPLQKGQ
jgi:hypothetical protein